MRMASENTSSNNASNASKMERIGASADLTESSAAICFAVGVMHRSAIVERKAFAIRFRGQAYAYLNECAHVPQEMDWQPGKFFDLSGLYLVCAKDCGS
jgi:nitrite reductase/ring-hydroxylating ferredoxin subunit